MNAICPKSTAFRHSAIRQRGAVLIVALIVLVALALASLSLLRSVDIAGLITDNLSLKRSATSSADRGANTAMQEFLEVPDVTVNSAAHCYSAIVLTDSDARGIPIALQAADFDTRYPDCKVNITETQETLRFIVDRQCNYEGVVLPRRCILANRKSVAGPTPDDQPDAGDKPVYRTTVRVDGPKNTQSFLQVMFTTPD